MSGSEEITDAFEIVEIVDKPRAKSGAGDDRVMGNRSGDKLVAEINKIYAVVVIGDKSAIMKQDEQGITFLQVGAFKLWFANKHLVVGKRRVTWAEYWLQHEDRRQYKGVVFAPDGKTPPGCFNLWRGFAVEPKPGDCSKFLAHVHDNICCGSERRFNWVIAWFAQMVQQPAIKPGVSLAFRGPEGGGKTIVGEAFGSLLGPHYVGPVSEPRYVTGRFNSHMNACLLLHADEAFWAGDHTAEGKVKDLITGTKHPIEFKNKEVIWVANYIRLFVTGNEDWIVPASMEARRWGILDVGTDHMGDHAYFAAIKAELDNGGREALLHSAALRSEQSEPARGAEDSGLARPKTGVAHSRACVVV